MNDSCCSTACSSNVPPNKAKCPINGKEYPAVSPTTIKHHIIEPWDWKVKTQGYYFCDDPDCDVVYFGEDSSLIYQSDLRTEVGAKEKSPDRVLCYCFGVTMGRAKADNDIKSFVLKETKEQSCACETRNPSGRCCLKDFPNN